MELQGLRDLNHGRLISFFILVVLLGSLQLWVLMIVLKALDQPIELKRLLGDGGLFFFSTSLAIGSAVTLWDQKSTPFGGEDFLITLLLPGGIFFLTNKDRSCEATILSGGWTSPLSLMTIPLRQIRWPEFHLSF